MGSWLMSFGFFFLFIFLIEILIVEVGDGCDGSIYGGYYICASFMRGYDRRSRDDGGRFRKRHGEMVGWGCRGVKGK